MAISCDVHICPALLPPASEPHWNQIARRDRSEGAWLLSVPSLRKTNSLRAIRSDGPRRPPERRWNAAQSCGVGYAAGNPLPSTLLAAQHKEQHQKLAANVLVPIMHMLSPLAISPGIAWAKHVALQSPVVLPCFCRPLMMIGSIRRLTTCVRILPTH